MNLCIKGGNRVVTAESDYFRAFIKQLCGFFESGRTPVSQEETISIMDIRGAGINAIAHPEIWFSILNL